MSVIYGSSVKSARMTAVLNFVAGGTLELQTSADVILASLPLSDPQGDTPLNGVANLSIESGTAIAAGVAAKARVRKSGSTAISGLTVGLAGSGADIIMTNTNLAVGQSVSALSATLTHA